MYKRIKITVLVAGAVYLFFAVQVGLRVYRDTRSKADAILVLGAKSYKGDRPNPCLVARVSHGVNLYKQGLAPQLVFSGGNDAEDGANEAETMKKIALELGASPSAILLEKTSKSTYENFVNAKKLLDAQKKFSSIIIVTEPFHMPRAAMVARMVKLPAFVSPAVDSPCWTRWKFASRYFLKEPLAILWYFVAGRLAPFMFFPDPDRAYR